MKVLKHIFKGKVRFFLFMFMLFWGLGASEMSAVQPMRRVINPKSPMWLVHIDTWNYADPQKIIDLIPKDIRPYVVMNISLSISHNTTTNRFQVAEYGYTIAKSWLKVCAQNRMWATVQCASGGYSQFSEFDLSVYEEFFREFPNFLGFNYAEQFWGFDDRDPLSPKWPDRMNHFADLLKLSNKYGGYLIVSWCANQWSPSINPIAMLKRNPAFATACRNYTENYILCEKYTQISYISDVESLCLGAYLSGYSGNYGIRYDDTGWTNKTTTTRDTLFTMATALAPHLEHAMLTGQTVIDGPELIWTQCFRGLNDSPTSDGYTRRNWTTFNQFENVSIDLFRKILDGTVRIPTRKEVIDRTKFVMINDVNNSNNNETYSSPQTIFEGLYRMDGDGNYENNRTIFKKTGRYPTIPTVYALDDTDAKSFLYKVNRSAYSTRWPAVSNKVTEFNSVFPQQYTGTIYAGRHENGWVVYNPFKNAQRATGNIPFKYNTCERMDLNFAFYSTGVVKEYADKLEFYLNNYDNVINTALKRDTIRIYGSTLEPTYTWKDRAKHTASVLSKTWSGGVFTLEVAHNGALDLTINCAGEATGRETVFTPSEIIQPTLPPNYTGPLQYEAECADVKSVSNRVNAGQNGSVRNYNGQGYVVFGSNTSAAIRDTVTALRNGLYTLGIRYAAASSNVSGIEIYVNGIKAATPIFAKTASQSTWSEYTLPVYLKPGGNSVIISSSKSVISKDIIFDYISVNQGYASTIYDFEYDDVSTEAQTPAAQFVSVLSGTAGVVTYTNNASKTSNGIKAYTTGAVNGTGVASLDLFPTEASDYHVIWKENNAVTGGKKGFLIRGTGTAGSCPYADGMKQGYLFTTVVNADQTVSLSAYVATTLGLTAKSIYTSSFNVSPNQPCWFRATAQGSVMTFECSTDSLNWEGASSTSFTDATFATGSTQVLWGFDSNILDWNLDNIQYGSRVISVSRTGLTGLGYTVGSGPATAQSFTVAAKDLLNPIQLIAPNNFELSLNASSGYVSSLQITPTSGAVLQTTIYVRAKSGLYQNKYSGNVRVYSEGYPEQVITVAADIAPAPISKMYTFSNDVAATYAQTPPAANVSVGTDNPSTAGVVSLTDLNGLTSNMLKPYTAAGNSGTGVLNLNAFSTRSTDYSITWKQCLTNAGSDYKAGILLRGDPSQVGNASQGYTQGIYYGYLFIVNNVGSGGTQFRIYKTTLPSTSISASVNITVGTWTPVNNQPVWYRVSATGSTAAVLKFEYSADSVTWNTAATFTDSNAPCVAGATQVVWGLNTGNSEYCLDNITFRGLESALSATIDLAVSENALTGMSYVENAGPSVGKRLFVSGSLLSDNVLITAPDNYEVSQVENGTYAPTLTLTRSNGALAQTPVFVRLKSGLVVNAYSGDLTVSSLNARTVSVALSGSVTPLTSVEHPNASLTVLSSEYYTITGQRLGSDATYKGLLIVKNRMSDGSIQIEKVIRK